MSKGRMDDLLRLLEADGWLLRDPETKFSIVNEIVCWRIERPQSDTAIEIDFHAFGDLGEKSNSLTDILYCVVRDRAIKLYFEKRESEKWKPSLETFVAELRRG